MGSQLWVLWLRMADNGWYGFIMVGDKRYHKPNMFCGFKVDIDGLWIYANGGLSWWYQPATNGGCWTQIVVPHQRVFIKNANNMGVHLIHWHSQTWQPKTLFVPSLASFILLESLSHVSSIAVDLQWPVRISNQQVWQSTELQTFQNDWQQQGSQKQSSDKDNSNFNHPSLVNNSLDAFSLSKYTSLTLNKSKSEGKLRQLRINLSMVPMGLIKMLCHTDYSV